MKLWIQNRAGVESVQAAADLANQYVSHRGGRNEAPPAKT